MLLSHKPVKATRKEHQCHGCLAMIPVGSAARKDAGVTWGDFWSIVWCASCLDWLKAHPSFWDEREDGCMPGDVAEEKRLRAGTAEDGASSAREASAVPQDQGATPSSAPLAHEDTK